MPQKHLLPSPLFFSAAAAAVAISSLASPAVAQITTFPWTEDFSNFNDAINVTGFQLAEGEPASPTTTFAAGPASDDTISRWGSNDFGNDTFTADQSASVNTYLSSQYDWLITPQIDLGTTVDYRVSFDFAVTDYANTFASPGGFGPDKYFTVLISTDGGATWDSANELLRYDAATDAIAPVSPAGQVESIDLSAYTGTVRLAFVSASDTSDSVDIDLFVDDITISEIPAATAPGAPNLAWPFDGRDGVSISGTNLSWNPPSAGGLPTSYIVYLGTDGGGTSTPTSIANGIDVGSAEVFATGALTYGETYYWQVEATNADGTTASPIYSFTAEPDPVVRSFPWTEDFNDLTPGGPQERKARKQLNFLPPYWQEATGDLADPVSFNSGPANGDFSAWNPAPFANDMLAGSTAMKLNVYSNRNDWLITPQIDLGTGGNAYVLTFDTAIVDFNTTDPSGFDSDDALVLLISTDGGTTWTSTNEIARWDSNNPLTGSQTVSITGYSGIVRLGFFVESTSSTVDVDLFIDNVVLDLDTSSVGDWSLHAY